MTGRGVADNLTSMGTSFPPASITKSTSVPALAPEVDARVNAAMGQRLHNFRQNRRFHDGASHGAGSRVFGAPEPGEVTERTHVRAIHFCRFHESFPDVGKVRPKNDHLVRRFEYGQPSLDRVHRDAEVSVTCSASSRFWEPVNRN